jgi:phosphatidylserine/phosphatidylglycerophosphate/cardiolipin synthase-like enzyme
LSNVRGDILKKLLINIWPIIIFTLYISISVFAQEFPSTGTIDVYFSPNGGCTDAIVKEISAAKQEILIQAYSFTSKPIAQALVDANNRNVHVEIVVDKGQKSEKYSLINFTTTSNIPTYIDSMHNIAHNKIIIIDSNTLITGSFNFSNAAETHNAENLLIIKNNKQLVDLYIQNFKSHEQHSEKYIVPITVKH